MRSLKKEIKGIIIALTTILLMVGAYLLPAYGLSDEEAQVKGYEGFEKHPEKFDFTGLWKKPPKSLEELSHGKIKVGMVITKDNVDLIKEYLAPGLYQCVKNGMVLRMANNLPPEKLNPRHYLEATERNRGKAVIDDHGVVRLKDGSEWPGGIPFIEPKNWPGGDGVCQVGTYF